MNKYSLGLIPLRTHNIRQRACTTNLTTRVSIEVSISHFDRLLYRPHPSESMQGGAGTYRVPIYACGIDAYYRNGNNLKPGPSIFPSLLSRKPFSTEQEQESSAKRRELFTLDSESDFDINDV